MFYCRYCCIVSAGLYRYICLLVTTSLTFWLCWFKWVSAFYVHPFLFIKCYCCLFDKRVFKDLKKNTTFWSKILWKVNHLYSSNHTDVLWKIFRVKSCWWFYLWFLFRILWGWIKCHCCVCCLFYAWKWST